MKKLLLLLLFLGAISLSAQQQPDSLLIRKIPVIQEQITEQQDKIGQLNLKISELQKDSLVLNKIESVQLNLENQQERIQQLNSELRNLKNLTNQQNLDLENLRSNYDSLLVIAESQKGLIETNNTSIKSIANDLGTKIQKTEEQTENKISELGGDVDKNRLYWIIATVVTLLLGGLIYWLLGNRITFNKTNVEAQIRNAKASIEEESVKLDNKLVEVLTKQLEVIKVDQATNSQTSENDHSLVLKVADRLTAMETNHYRMDPKTKGLKQLVRAVKSIKENYLASGYEIVEMMGQEYKEGSNSTVNFITSEDLEVGEKIITKIIKPQVNFNGKMIQAAQIEVSVGE